MTDSTLDLRYPIMTEKQMTYILSPLMSSEIVPCGTPIPDIILPSACVARLNQQGGCTFYSCVKKIRTYLKTHRDPKLSQGVINTRPSVVKYASRVLPGEEKEYKQKFYSKLPNSQNQGVSLTIPQSGITSFGSRNEAGWHRAGDL